MIQDLLNYWLEIVKLTKVINQHGKIAEITVQIKKLEKLFRQFLITKTIDFCPSEIQQVLFTMIRSAIDEDHLKQIAETFRCLTIFEPVKRQDVIKALQEIIDKEQEDPYPQQTELEANVPSDSTSNVMKMYLPMQVIQPKINDIDLKQAIFVLQIWEKLIEEKEGKGDNVSGWPNRLYATLIGAGIITEEQWECALSIHDHEKVPKMPIEQILIELGLITREEADQLLEQFFGCPHIELYEYAISRDAISILTKKECLDNKIIPCNVEGNILAIAINNPFDLKEIEGRIKRYINMEIQIVHAHWEDMRKTIEMYYKK